MGENGRSRRPEKRLTAIGPGSRERHNVTLSIGKGSRRGPLVLPAVLGLRGYLRRSEKVSCFMFIRRSRRLNLGRFEQEGPERAPLSRPGREA